MNLLLIEAHHFPQFACLERQTSALSFSLNWEYTPNLCIILGVWSLFFDRIVKIPKSRSFFLFGARGTGKSTLLRTAFEGRAARRIDLLLPAVEERLSRDPQSLIAEVEALPPEVEIVALDEVQKVPKLLDVVHFLLEERKSNKQFVLTGSSGRKLKRGGANLLAGRAFVRELFPLISTELGASFQTSEALAWGTLPFIYALGDAEEKAEYLASYVRTYVSEEIQREQVVRNLDPFRKFLEVAAQYNGKIINYSNISRGIGVDPKTVASYYEILEDTLLGHIVLPFDASFRKRLIKSPKFYFFDSGVCRALARTLSADIVPSTSYYGDLFEHFVATQVIHLARYQSPDTKISFYHDENNIEVDLVIEKPLSPPIFVEIKSTKEVHETMAKHLRTVQKDFPSAVFQLWSQDPIKKRWGSIDAFPWQEGLNQLF